MSYHDCTGISVFNRVVDDKHGDLIYGPYVFFSER